MEELLKTIKDADTPDENSYQTREAARAVVFDAQGKVLILAVTAFAYHKLPGGGVESGENLEQTLTREVAEETGCAIDILKKIGTILEYRSAYNLKQISHCYIAEVTEEGPTNFTDKETDEGFKLTRMTLEEAIHALETDEPQNYEGIFIQKRDLAFLQAAQSLLGRQTSSTSDTRKGTSGPWARGSSEGQRRIDIKPGLKVAIVLKKDQRTGKLTEGIVKELLTSSANHPRGVKVRLTDGQVGRVQKII